MTTRIHTRNTQYRNLYRAVPVATKFTTHKVWERETKELIEAAHLKFWARRKMKAPWVSKDTVGAFDLPKEDT